MNLHPALAIVNEAQLPEPVHDKVNPRPSCAHHLCQSLLTDFGNCNFGLSVLAEVSQQEKNASKSFLAGIEKLIKQILFVSDVPCQQKCHEHFGKRMFPVKHFHHGLLIDSHHRAIGHCGCGAQAERLPYKATIFEKITLVQNAYCGFLPPPRHNGELHLSFLYVKNSIGRVALNKDPLLFGKSCDLPTFADGRKECLGIEFAGFLGRYNGCHDWPPLKSSEGAEGIKIDHLAAKQRYAALWSHESHAGTGPSGSLPNLWCQSRREV